MKRLLGHLGQRVGFAHCRRIADAGLNIAPPAVIGAAEANQMRPACVVSREPYRLHDRFGARHMERHLVLTGYLTDAFDVVGSDRMIGTQHRPEVTDTLRTARNALLVEIVPKRLTP